MLRPTLTSFLHNTVRQRLHGSGSVWNRTKLVQMRLVFTWELVGPVRSDPLAAIWYQMSPLMKVIPYGTVPFQFQTGPAERIRAIVDHLLLTVRY